MYRGNPSLEKMEKFCVPASEAASADFETERIYLREKISARWKVCMWCWRENPKDRISGIVKKKVLAFECGENCPAWGKPVKLGKGVMTRKLK